MAEKGDPKAKNALQAHTAALMPQGMPTYTEVVKYPPIAALIAENGRLNILKVVVALLTDLNTALNVVRPMSETQIADVAEMMLDECGDFRIEDYYMLCNMIKRGRLVKIMDRLDISVISSAMDEYYKQRREAGIKKQEREVTEYDGKLNAISAAMTDEIGAAKIQEMLTAWKNEDKAEEERRAAARQKQIDAYIVSNNLNGEEILKQFGKQK